MEPKLIFIEGLPNSGKTTALKMTERILTEMGTAANALFESDLDAPLDNHCNAYLDEGSFRRVMRRFPTEGEVLAELSEQYMGGRVVRYRKYKDRFSRELYAELSEHDFYKLPIRTNYELVNGKWRDFLTETANDGAVYAVECALLQNPTHISLIRDSLPVAELRRRVRELQGLIANVPHLLIYIGHNDPKNILRNSGRRSPGWIRSNAGFFTDDNAYGRARNLSGEKGALRAYEHMNRVHGSILTEMRCPTHVVDNSRYDEQELESQLRALMVRYFADVDGSVAAR